MRNAYAFFVFSSERTKRRKHCAKPQILFEPSVVENCGKAILLDTAVPDDAQTRSRGPGVVWCNVLGKFYD